MDSLEPGEGLSIADQDQDGTRPSTLKGLEPQQ